MVSKKNRMEVIQANSLRELVGIVNSYNESSERAICKEDIVSLLRDNDTYLLVYYC